MTQLMRQSHRGVWSNRVLHAVMMSSVLFLNETGTCKFHSNNTNKTPLLRHNSLKATLHHKRHSVAKVNDNKCNFSHKNDLLLFMEIIKTYYIARGYTRDWDMVTKIPCAKSVMSYMIHP